MPCENLLREPRRLMAMIVAPVRMMIEASDPATRETVATPPTKIVTMAAAGRVVVAEVAVVRDNPPLDSDLPAPAPSQLAPPSRDATVAAVHAAPRIVEASRIVAVHPTVASPRLADPPIADHPPSTATLVHPNELRHHRNLSPKDIAANVAA